MTKNDTLPINIVFKLTPENLEIKENNITISTIALKSFFKTITQDDSYKETRYKEIQDNEKLDLVYHDKNLSIKLMLLEINTNKNDSFDHIRVKLLYKRH